MKTPTSSPNESSYSYDVFISFRGPDTRKCFIGYLYKKLCDVCIPEKIFMDDRIIEPGDLKDETLFHAIRESKIGLVVFSPNYFSSRYCLEELAMIIELSINQKCMLFVPVFYDVDHSVLSPERGSYEEALTKHEARFGKHKIHYWRTALKNAARASGFTSKRYRYVANRSFTSLSLNFFSFFGTKFSFFFLNIYKEKKNIEMTT